MSIILRTVRNGSVRIHGRDFRVDDSTFPYDGRLDGKRMAFGLYSVGPDVKDYVSLWGTAERFLSHDPDWEGDEPEVIDGVLHWLWWKVEGDPQ